MSIKDTEVTSSEENNERVCKAQTTPPSCKRKKMVLTPSSSRHSQDSPKNMAIPPLTIRNQGIAIYCVSGFPTANHLTVPHALTNAKSWSHVNVVKPLLNAYPNMLALEKQQCSLLMVQIALETVKFLKSTEAEINRLLMELQGLFSIFPTEKTYIIDTQKLSNHLHHISSTFDMLVTDTEKLSLKFHKVLPVISNSTFYDILVSRYKSLYDPKQSFMLSCKISQAIDRLASLLIDFKVKYVISNDNSNTDHHISITKMLWSCKTLKDKNSNIAEMLCTCFQENNSAFYPTAQTSKLGTSGYKLTYNFVLLQPQFEGKYLPNSDISCIDSISDYLCQVAKRRSHVVVSELCTVTLKALKKASFSSLNSNADPERSSFFNLKSQSPTNNLKSTLKLIKTYFKRLLKNQNDYIENLLYELEYINDELLRGNTDILYKKLRTLGGRSSSSSSESMSPRRVVYWESSLGPAQKDLLYSTYMDELWREVKKAISQCYVQSIFDSSLEICRMNDIVLSRQEQELLWQVQVMISKKDNSPQKFLGILNTLSINIGAFHNSQRFDVELSKTMGLLLKDRFRYVDGDGITPSSATLSAFLKCQMFIQEQFKCLQKHNKLSAIPNGVASTSRRCCGGSDTASLLHQLLTLHSFLRTFLLSKRQRFLLSATWEQFLVITASDVKISFLSCHRFLSRLKEALKTDVAYLSMERNALDDQLQFLEMFEENSMHVMGKQVANRSRAVWKEHMTQLKLWKRRGTKIQVYSPSSYIKIAMQMIFSPIMDCLHFLTQEQKIAVLCKCITSFVRTWMDHILNVQIIFSRYGAQQLDFDFNHFVDWFESEEFGMSLDEIAEIHSLAILCDMKNAIILLACQPEGRKNGSNTVGREETNLLSNNFGSSSSVVSQVSIESFHGSQFDEVISQIEIHNKEKWLALRAKGGQAKRFLCIS